MQTIKTLIYILAGTYAVAFLDGMLSLDLSGDLYLVMGLTQLIVIITLIVKVRKLN